jgi:preprotein translocase subunit SecD
MKITFRIWILIFFLVISVISIFSFTTMFSQTGVDIKFIEKNSSLAQNGLKSGTTLLQINGQTINSLLDYEKAVSIFADNQTHKLAIKTSSGEIINYFAPDFTSNIIVGEKSLFKIKTGLDIQGGARALIVAQNHSLTDSELTDLISLSQQRFNVFGLTDLSIRKASDLTGNNYMVIEIAGSSPKDLENLILEQGKFEAKIGNITVFTGGKDISHVERSGQQSGIESCSQDSYSGKDYCKFRFAISLTEEAAQRHADITSNIPLSVEQPEYLSQKLDLYVDGALMDSLLVSKDLKGKVTTQIAISGSGSGVDTKSAIADAEANMKKLQTILITGSLPYKLEIVKLDTISPTLGKKFTEAILLSGLFAILAVSIIIFLRYKQIKISLALLLTSFSELVIILGFAALIKWNIDLPSIAGIIATIGTGVDSQIVILDESRFKIFSLKERIKKALFIIFTSFATAAVSLLPLTGFFSFMGIGAAGAGLLRGFAITTLIGIIAGVFITRPAFADIIKHITKE